MPRTRTAATLLAFAGLTLCVPTAIAVAAEPVPAPPVAPVVVDDACGISQDTIQIPQTEGVTYSVDVDGQRAILPEGVKIPAIIALFASVDEVYLEQAPEQLTMKLDATADEGYVLTPDAVDSATVTVDSSPCAPVTLPALKVASDECEQVTITNPAGNPEAYFITSNSESLKNYDTVIPNGSTATLKVPEGAYEWHGLDSAVIFGWAAGLQAKDGGSDLTTRRDASAALAQDSDDALKVRVPDLPGARGAGARPDEWELTAEDIADLRELSAIFDGYATNAFNLGGGDIEVDVCDDGAADPTTPTADPVGTDDDTPRVPFVVQTDGGPATHTTGALALISTGLLAAGAFRRKVLS